ncbi:MAG: hypothetical protein OXG60_12615, partial [Chloroflexi bacterium]|nr:hypothetical protein [Chloroflexota bacterium]
ELDAGEAAVDALDDGVDDQEPFVEDDGEDQCEGQEVTPTEEGVRRLFGAGGVRPGVCIDWLTHCENEVAACER